MFRSTKPPLIKASVVILAAAKCKCSNFIFLLRKSKAIYSIILSFFFYYLGEKGGWGHCNPSFVFFCRLENYKVVNRVKLLEHKRMPLGIKKLFNFHDGNILKWELVK